MKPQQDIARGISTTISISTTQVQSALRKLDGVGVHRHPPLGVSDTSSGHGSELPRARERAIAARGFTSFTAGQRCPSYRHAISETKF